SQQRVRGERRAHQAVRRSASGLPEPADQRIVHVPLCHGSVRGVRANPSVGGIPVAEAVTDEDVKKQRAVVEQLRQELAQKRAWMTDEARAGENAVKKARLDAEAEMLRNEIASL